MSRGFSATHLHLLSDLRNLHALLPELIHEVVLVENLAAHARRRCLHARHTVVSDRAVLNLQRTRRAWSGFWACGCSPRLCGEAKQPHLQALPRECSGRGGCCLLPCPWPLRGCAKALVGCPGGLALPSSTAHGGPWRSADDGASGRASGSRRCRWPPASGHGPVWLGHRRSCGRFPHSASQHSPSAGAGALHASPRLARPAAALLGLQASYWVWLLALGRSGAARARGRRSWARPWRHAEPAASLVRRG